MTQHEALQRARFDALPQPPDDSDWADVCRRARAMSAGQRRRPVLVGVLAAATLAAAAVLTPGLGVSGSLFDLFTGEAAPAEVERAFAQVDVGAPANLSPGVIAEDAHKLVEIPTSDGGKAILWVAPTESGGWCRLVQLSSRPVQDGAGCNGPGEAEDAPALGAGLEGGRAEGSPVLMVGNVDPGVTQLELSYEDGETAVIQPVKGFFLFEIPSRHYEQGRRPSFLVGKDGQGVTLVEAPVSQAYGIFPESN